MGGIARSRSYSACRHHSHPEVSQKLDGFRRFCAYVLRRLTPEFMAPWKKEAKFLRNVMNGLYGGLWRQCKERHLAGDVRPCLADELVSQQKELDLTDHQIAFMLGVQLEGGSDTVSTFAVQTESLTK